MHECRTQDGVVITLGLQVVDYDARQGVVVRPPQFGLEDPECWPSQGHGGHWWEVCPDREGHVHQRESLTETAYRECRGKIFDGSRLTTRGVRR